jgi:hypothetical protein
MKKIKTNLTDECCTLELYDEKKAFDEQKKYLLKKTYIGKIGTFHKGKDYILTAYQYDILKEDLK